MTQELIQAQRRCLSSTTSRESQLSSSGSASESESSKKSKRGSMSLSKLKAMASKQSGQKRIETTDWAKEFKTQSSYERRNYRNHHATSSSGYSSGDNFGNSSDF
jgi:hypothetical protein